MIDPGLRRSVRRRAGIAFWVTAVAVAVAVAAVVSAYQHMVIALLFGILVGIGAGVVVAAAVLVWPIVRVLWHWLPEIAVAAGVPFGLTQLATMMPPPAAVLSVAALAGLVAVFPRSRRVAVSWVWCVVSRHRLRVCFSAFLAGNRDGSLPLILWAYPTPVGERVYAWLRPGLSLSMLTDRVEQIAVACWANEVTVQRGSTKYAGFLRFDIKRRNTLAGVIASPLTEDIPDAPARVIPTQAPVGGLDLPDVPATEVIETEPVKAARKPATRPEPTKAPALVGADNSDDVSDWI
ncbi:MAG: hypothetical protein ACRDT4_05160 [Micromonosporaceae bacterium]